MIHKNNSKLINNSFYSMADFLIVTSLSFIFWLIVGKTLSVENFGIIATSINISLLISAVALIGLPNATTSLISKYLHKRNTKKIKGLIKFSFKFSFLVNSLISLSILIFSDKISTFTNLPIEAIWITSLLIFGWTFWLLTTGILQGFERMKTIYKSNLIGNIIKISFTLILFLIFSNFIGPLIALLISLIVTIFMRYNIFHLRNSYKIDIKYIFKKYSLPLFLPSIIWLIFLNLPNIILNSLTTNFITGLFALSLTIATPILFIPMTLNQALFPIISRLSVQKNTDKIKSKLITSVIRYSIFISFPIISLLIIFSNEIILIFSQLEYLQSSELFILVIPATFLLGIGQIFILSIFSLGKRKAVINITIISILLFVVFSIPATIFLSGFGMGLVYLFSMLFLVLTSYFYIKNKIKLKIQYKSILKIFTASFIFIIIILPLNNLFDSLFVKIFLVISGILIYLVVLKLINYYTKEDLKVLKYLGSKSNILNKILKSLMNILSIKY